MLYGCLLVLDEMLFGCRLVRTREEVQYIYSTYGAQVQNWTELIDNNILSG